MSKVTDISARSGIKERAGKQILDAISEHSDREVQRKTEVLQQLRAAAERLESEIADDVYGGIAASIIGKRVEKNARYSDACFALRKSVYCALRALDLKPLTDSELVAAIAEEKRLQKKLGLNDGSKCVSVNPFRRDGEIPAEARAGVADEDPSEARDEDVDGDGVDAGDEEGSAIETVSVGGGKDGSDPSESSRTSNSKRAAKGRSSSKGKTQTRR